jgi:hypothetical protein
MLDFRSKIADYGLEKISKLKDAADGRFSAA